MIIHHTCQLKTLVKSLESTAYRIFKWFSDNQLKGIGNNYHVLLGIKEKVTNVNSTQIENSHSEKLLEVIINSKLSF